MTQPGEINFDTMKPEEFENYLPDLFANGNGRVSQDPRLQKFLSENPDCAALVRDLETIADTAKGFFMPMHDPSDRVWDNIASEMRKDSMSAPEPEADAAKEDMDEVKEID